MNVKWLAGGDDDCESYEVWDRNLYVQIDKHGINDGTMFVPKTLILDIADAIKKVKQ